MRWWSDQGLTLSIDTSRMIKIEDIPKSNLEETDELSKMASEAEVLRAELRSYFLPN